MKNNAQMTSAALILAATTGYAAAGSLDLDRSYAAELKSDAGARSVLNQGNLGNITVSAGIRFGYDYNSVDGRANSDNDTTMGFGFKDAEIAIEGDVTENMHARISFDFGPNDSAVNGAIPGAGTGVLEDAFVDWAVNDTFTLRVGQFIPAFSAEASASEFHTMNTFRSVSHEWLATPGWTQGIEAAFGGDTWDFSVGFNDGPATSATPFNSAFEFDWGINARFDVFSDSDKARFADQTSWRGSAAGWRAGAGVMLTSNGKTNPASFSGGSSNDTIFTIDAAYEADGWAVRGAFYYYDNERGTINPKNMGFELGGSFFFSDQWEGFARWDTLILDDDAANFQLNDAAGDDIFNFIAIGANYYFVPESHAAKFTIELGISLDETGNIAAGGGGDTGVFVLGTPSGSFAGSSGFFQENAGEDGQIMISGTMQWMF